MRQDPYKKLKFQMWLIPRLVGAGIILIVVIVITIFTTMQQSEQLYLEGLAKSMPLVSNEKLKMFGDLYIELNGKYEKEIKDLQIDYCRNRKNKRGDKIYYGVNGKENVDWMKNLDYVNGYHITYEKGDDTKIDGQSNFIDMMAFLSTALGSDMDKYSDEELKTVFTKLFEISHTYMWDSTELYPCEHGCSWCKYYCGDFMCQGTLSSREGGSGDIVGFYKCDMYMGESGRYGLMYDPFLITKTYHYPELQEYAGNERELKTIFSGTGADHMGVVVCEDDEMYSIAEIEGICEVCSQGALTFNRTTKTFAGCQQELECHHGTLYGIEEGMITIDPPVYSIGDESGHSSCSNCSIVPGCSHVCGENEEECPHDNHEPPFDADGCWACNGHPHYACPGHVIVTCFGHTDLNLTIKTMYYEEMLDKMIDIFNKII